MTGATISAGDFVILDVNGEKLSFVQVTPKGTAKIGKASVPAQALVGLPYGSLVEVTEDGEGLQQIAREEPELAEAQTGGVTRDNRELNDAGAQNQALTTEQISELRASGQGGRAIVAALASNSATYASKTAFSQEKYRRKKSRKYCVQATLVQPSARSICETMFLKAPGKIGNLRVDALALLLSLADIGAHSRALVWDTCGGLVTGAVGERMGGQGEVCSVFTGRSACQDTMRLFNFPERVRHTVHAVPFAELQQRLDASSTEATSSSDWQPNPLANGVHDEGQSTPMDVDRAISIENGISHPKSSLAAASQPRRQSGADRLNSGQPLRSAFTSCLVAAPGVSPAAAWHWLEPFLGPSASLAFFCPYMQPLAELMQTLQHSKGAVALQLQEIWWREYQVLPLRTHPEMNAAQPSGYILSGIKIGA